MSQRHTTKEVCNSSDDITGKSNGVGMDKRAANVDALQNRDIKVEGENRALMAHLCRVHVLLLPLQLDAAAPTRT